MASVDVITFDKASYAPGDTVDATVNYTPDTPSVVSQTFNATFTLNDANGNPVASNSAPFVLNTPQAGDKGSMADDGGHSWTETSDNGSVWTGQTQV